MPYEGPSIFRVPYGNDAAPEDQETIRILQASELEDHLSTVLDRVL